MADEVTNPPVYACQQRECTKLPRTEHEGGLHSHPTLPYLIWRNPNMMSLLRKRAVDRLMGR